MTSPTKRPRVEDEEIVSPESGSEKDVGSSGGSHHSGSSSALAAPSSSSSRQKEGPVIPSTVPTQFPSAPPRWSTVGYPHQEQIDNSIRIASEQSVSISRLGYVLQAEISELMARQPRLREELEACCFDSLSDFDEATAIEIVRKFGQRDLTTIRNATAYFCGLLKRYRERGAALNSHHRNTGIPETTFLVSPNGTYYHHHPSTTLSMDQSSSSRRALHQHVAHTAQGQAEQAQSIALLNPAVRDAVESIFTVHGVGRYEMEPCCFESLRDFSEPVALNIVNEFRNADMNTLRDKTAYFCSILKRYRSQGQGNTHQSQQMNNHPLSQHYLITSQVSGQHSSSEGRLPRRRTPSGWSLAAGVGQSNGVFCDSPGTAGTGAPVPSVLRDPLYMTEPTSPWTGQAGGYSFDSADPYTASLHGGPHHATLHPSAYSPAYPTHAGLIAAPPTAFYAQANVAAQAWGPYMTQ